MDTKILVGDPVIVIKTPSDDFDPNIIGLRGVIVEERTLSNGKRWLSVKGIMSKAVPTYDGTSWPTVDSGVLPETCFELDMKDDLKEAILKFGAYHTAFMKKGEDFQKIYDPFLSKLAQDNNIPLDNLKNMLIQIQEFIKTNSPFKKT